MSAGNFFLNDYNFWKHLRCRKRTRCLKNYCCVNNVISANFLKEKMAKILIGERDMGINNIKHY